MFTHLKMKKLTQGRPLCSLNSDAVIFKLSEYMKPLQPINKIRINVGPLFATEGQHLAKDQRAPFTGNPQNMPVYEYIVIPSGQLAMGKWPCQALFYIHNSTYL